MKRELNENVFNEFELRLFGVQAYGVIYGEEYNVIVKAARRANGRYYFKTREGYEIAWSILPADQVENICRDMYDQHAADELATIKKVNQLCNYGTALVPAEIMNQVYDTADAIGVTVYILTSGVNERGDVLYYCSLGTTADEGRAIARAAAPAADETAAEDVPAQFVNGETEKIARHMIDNAAPVTAEIINGVYVYHVGNLLPYNMSEATAERVAAYIEDRETMATHALELGGPNDYFERERRNARAALDRLHAADVAAREAMENGNESADQTPAEEMTTATPENATTGTKIARTAAKVVAAAALVVLSFTTTPGTIDTPTPADQFTTYHATTTAEAVRVLSQLAAQGLPLYHVTIKTGAK